MMNLGLSNVVDGDRPSMAHTALRKAEVNDQPDTLEWDNIIPRRWGANNTLGHTPVTAQRQALSSMLASAALSIGLEIEPSSLRCRSLATNDAA